MEQKVLTMLHRLNWPLILLTLLASCKTPSVEVTDKEVCIFSVESHALQCTDLTRDKKNYSRPIEGGDIVTNSVDYFNSIKETADIIEQLKRCRAGQ